ncbi:TRAP transporter small permease [Hoeflea sp. CAU 1731]
MKRIINTVSTALASVGAVAVILLMLHVCADVVARNVFVVAIPGTSDIVARYYMIALTFLPLALTEQKLEMISVDLVNSVLPNVFQKLLLRAVALISVGVYGVLGYLTWLTAIKSFHAGTFIMVENTRIFVWPTYFMLPLAFAAAGFICLMRCICAVPGHQNLHKA